MDLDTISRETLEEVAKAQTSGYTSGLGLTGIDLTPYTVLVPITTHTLDSIGRESSPNGDKKAQWKALLNVNNQQPNPFVGADYAGGLVVLDEQDMFSPYVPLALGYTVTQDAVDYAKGYADARALTTLQTLNQLRQQENKGLIGGQNYALPTIGTVTATTATTGGSIASGGDLDIKCAARSGGNYYWGGSGVASAATRATCGTTTSTNSVVASVAAVKGAVAYDWFVGTHGGTLYFLTTTTVAKVTITAIPTANQAVPALHDLSTVAPTTPPTADTSYSANQFNGIIASVVGDYGTAGLITPGGSGVSSSSTWTDNGANTLTLSGGSIAEIDALFLSIYNTSRLSPDGLWMSAHHAQDLSNKVLGSPSAVIYMQPADKTDRAAAVIGGFAGSYVNRAAGGKIVPIMVDPDMPSGTIIARTDKIPYPGANIDAAWKVRTLRDYADFQYGANRTLNVAGGGPREDGEVRSQEALISKAPLAQGILTNIQTG